VRGKRPTVASEYGPTRMRRTVAFAVLAASLVSACNVVLGEQGSGVIVTRRFELPAQIQRIELGDAFAGTIAIGPGKPSAAVQIDDNLVDRLRVEVDGDSVAVDVNGRVRDATLQVEITLPRLRELHLSGASRASVDGPLVDDVTVEGSGASEIQLGAVDLDEFDIALSGASKLSGASGSANRVTTDVSGASNLSLFGVEADEVHVDVSGASRAGVTARERLEASASGASSVTYHGEPDHVIRDESGASSIEPA
jgi:Putative auto-transporter adhesin, head GIN domain